MAFVKGTPLHMLRQYRNSLMELSQLTTSYHLSEGVSWWNHHNVFFLFLLLKLPKRYSGHLYFLFWGWPLCPCLLVPCSVQAPRLCMQRMVISFSPLMNPFTSLLSNLWLLPARGSLKHTQMSHCVNIDYIAAAGYLVQSNFKYQALPKQPLAAFILSPAHLPFHTHWGWAFTPSTAKLALPWAARYSLSSWSTTCTSVPAAPSVQGSREG